MNMHGFNFNVHYPVLGPIYCFQFAPFDSFCLLSYIVKRFIHSRWFSASIYLSLALPSPWNSLFFCSSSVYYGCHENELPTSSTCGVTDWVKAPWGLLWLGIYQRFCLKDLPLRASPLGSVVECCEDWVLWVNSGSLIPRRHGALLGCWLWLQKSMVALLNLCYIA